METDELFAQMMVANEVNNQHRADAILRLRVTSRRRLLSIIEKKLRTSFIGSLAAFEETIGRELWGHGKPDKDCSESELYWRSQWQDKVRPAVLNNGNNQLRAMQAEVELYDVLWNGYQTELAVRGEKEGNSQ